MGVLSEAIDAAAPVSLLGVVAPLAAAPVLGVPELSAAIIGVDNVATKTVAARPARMRFICRVSSLVVPLRNGTGALLTVAICVPSALLTSTACRSLISGNSLP